MAITKSMFQHAYIYRPLKIGKDWDISPHVLRQYVKQKISTPNQTGVSVVVRRAILRKRYRKLKSLP